ncbi:MAG: tetratricopeptide repeat protein [Acidobacteria bacterium]|nr:MAG: tetratricopeptide repeat protein [Acidobacteriota bacterium]
MARMSRHVLLYSLLALVLHGCAGGGPGRVVVLALDGVDPAVVDLLLSEGKLPNFARLRQQGAYGRLESRRPLLSPVVWTTIATGKTPDQHQIGHFVAVNPQTGEQLPVTSQMRQVQGLWNILSDAGRKVSVVGWWATWPAETVHGSIVSDHLCYHFLFEDGFQRSDGEATGITYPPELVGELAPLVRRPDDLRFEEATPFLQVSPEEFSRPFDFQDEIAHFKWALTAAETYRDIGLHLWKTERPDVLMVYVEGVDSTSHLFGHLFRVPELSGELAEQQRRFGGTVEAMYLFADRIVGEYLDVLDRDTTLMVLSDHGFQLGALHDDPSKTRDMRRVSERYHNLHGILYLYGNGVIAGTRLVDATILDIAPTLLALSGVPAAEDMPGRVLTEALELEPPARVATYERAAGTALDVRGDSAVDPKILERLESLGYLSTSSPGGDRNLAALLFEEGRYPEAVEAYRGLVQQDPDDGSLRTSLAGALGALGDYDAALAQLEEALRIQPLNPEAYHNRAVLQERRGERHAAVEDYRNALRYNPQYEPSRNALARLGESADAGGPHSDAEKLAFLMAQRASDSARRGDYRGAMETLEEAQRIAPRYALIYQYRSNVAYLMGDREAAAEALREGLEIEPNNVLFQENLRNLERAPAP